ncbi:SAM-dependent methyltransferase [Jannaschia sp. S6380]|uniref:class I SAM-dependent methyltransferase n=1 Tax=Jannaschia sp. S6380 TaxID=2926408 RepID=UPI001FF367FD|nr:SAM-dependent methyltransferase [Jannaschia sp. S6380]MCK0167585.1 SAM-dependent methyltransferase [Jannaschia sp. S6380]
MTLRDHLLSRIAATGPMTVADYMADCLMHPTMGYYATRDPLGAAGDFTTAPEISQMFGELLGLCLAQVWLDQGLGRVTLAELGPGRGTLMADALRAMRGVPGLADAVAIHLVETSPALRDVQARTLAGHDVQWHDSVDTLPHGPLLLLANEFLDALPIRQHVRDEGGWRERLVAHTGADLTFALGPATLLPELSDREDLPVGTVVERCPALPHIVSAVGDRVARGGAAIFVDYGHWRSRGDTLQALRAHAPEDPLASPGQTDLTAHVDFEAVARNAGFARASGVVPQGVLLERLGITDRARALARGMQGAALDAHVAAHRRLTDPAEMGDLFKAIALVPPGAASPPGFDE